MEAFAGRIEFVPKYNETVPEGGRKEGHQGRCSASVFRIAVKDRTVISFPALVATRTSQRIEGIFARNP